MLEKIGLPAKPSMRGSNWVVDASHCQGCSSQFTFINRKHHCRRCGGLFCNSCTQQRMVLRGQGDSPVRICEPCKKLEEAARFEMRHGYKSKVGRGGSKVGMKYKDEVLNKINTDGKQPSLSGRGSTTSSEVSDVDRAIGIASSSSFHEEAAIHDGKEYEPQSDTLDEIGSNSPEELRQQAVEEKKKYRILKGENKPEEALRAFKRGKELERQAKALEIALKKSHRKALSSNSLASIQKTNDDLAESSIKSKSSTQMRKENKDDHVDELRELGWSDADLHDADKKPAKMSLEGELSSLLGESRSKSTVDKGGIDKTQVIALKKKALALKREGKIAEAKEELKQAKILEKQLEEQEFLSGEDSDDEISALIRSMDDDKEDDILLYREKDAGFDYDHLLGGAADLGDDGFFDVTDEDMTDPEITAALKSLGWTEDLDQQEVKAPASVFVDVNALRNEILSLKKEAVNQKRAGNASEALNLLRKAKLLEKDIEKFESQGSSSFAPNSVTQEGSTSEIAKKSSMPKKMDQGKFESVEDKNPKLPPKSKLMIQKELLGIKKKALALRREGRLDEADEELKKGKVLEYQLEEMENASKPSATKVSVVKDSKSVKKQLTNYEMSDLHLEIDGDVTEQDMHNPALLSQLEKLGWTDESSEHESLPSEPPKQIDNKSEHVSNSVIQSTPEVPVIAPRRSKAEIQRELLQLKRKALALRRQGEAEEAEDVLRMAKLLEAQMEALDAPIRDFVANSATSKDSGSFGSHVTQKMHGNTESVQENWASKPPRRNPVIEDDEAEVTEEDMHDPGLLSRLNDMGWKDEIVEPISTVKPCELSVNNSAQAPSAIPVVAVRRTKAEVQRELLGLKREALILRRQGEAEEAEKVLKLAKELEVQIEEMSAPKKDMLLDSSRDNKPEAFGSIISQEKPGNIKDVEVTRLSKLSTDPNDGSSELLGLDLNKSMTTKPPRLSSVDVTHEMSESIEDKSPLIEMPDPLAATTVDKDVGSFPQTGQSVQFMDLLTGGDWQNSESSVKDKGDEGSFSSGILSEGNSYVQLEVITNLKTGTGSKSEIIHGKEVKTVGTIEKTQVHDSNSTALQQEILARKRKAVSLKREGKLVEAREELRQAKLLEKGLQEDNPQPDAASIDVQISTNDTSPQKDDHRKASQATKPMTGRDRFKLQQESLAHKRQALKLRREGRIDEAEAKFELAKSLESQLEESASHDFSKVSSKRVNETEAIDDLGVEDLLDPQLLSALKAIGWQDVEIAPQVSSARPESAKPKIGKPETSDQEKNQLEGLIKAEKVKAVNLKRAGKQSEALDALRRAKMYEKKLNSLLS